MFRVTTVLVPISFELRCVESHSKLFEETLTGRDKTYQTKPGPEWNGSKQVGKRKKVSLQMTH